MYDALTGRFTFPCPARGEAHVTLSDFRQLERLPGAAHPSVFHVLFACGCGEEHEGLVTHDDLDWGPLGLQGGDLLQRHDRAARSRGRRALGRGRPQDPGGGVALELLLLPRGPAAARLSFVVLPARPGDGSLGLAVRCPACQRTSVNLVSHEHVDLPFHNDPKVGVVEHVFNDDVAGALEDFRAELYSASFDTRRLTL